MPERRQRWYNKRDLEVPDFSPDSQIYNIRSAQHAIESACLAKGTIFRSINNYAHNAMYMPLITVIEQMGVLMRTMDHWAFRAKFLQHLDPQLSRIYRKKSISETQKFQEIHRGLDQISVLDSDYCDVFEVTSKQLVPILASLESLITFLDTICREGNLLSSDGFPIPMASSSVPSTTEGPTAVNSDCTPETSTTTLPRLPAPELAPHLSDPLPTSPRSSVMHFTTPSWKLGLAHKYPVESLYVGEAELEVFDKVLTYAQKARDEVIAVDKMCKEFLELAFDMLEVFESWMDKCDEYADSLTRAQSGNNEFKSFDSPFAGSAT